MSTQLVSLDNKLPGVPSERGRLTMNFLEGARDLSFEELETSGITRYQVTKFYQEQIRKSGYYEQLKHIVEPSVQEFSSPGRWDTSGEHGNTVLPGLQHRKNGANAGCSRGSTAIR